MSCETECIHYQLHNEEWWRELKLWLVYSRVFNNRNLVVMCRATLRTWVANEISLLSDSTRSFLCCSVNVWLMEACLVYKKPSKTLGYRPIQNFKLPCYCSNISKDLYPSSHWVVRLFLNIPPSFGIHFLPIQALLQPTPSLWCMLSALTERGKNMLSSGYEHLGNCSTTCMQNEFLQLAKA